MKYQQRVGKLHSQLRTKDIKFAQCVKLSVGHQRINLHRKTPHFPLMIFKFQ